MRSMRMTPEATVAQAVEQVVYNLKVSNPSSLRCQCFKIFVIMCDLEPQDFEKKKKLFHSLVLHSPYYRDIGHSTKEIPIIAAN